MSDAKVTLVLSGGGIRATLFHLGVLAALKASNRFQDIDEIVSVSGGSINAAHFAKSWKQADATDEGFVSCAVDLVQFLKRNVRDSTLIRWLWSRLLLLWASQNYSRSSWLEWMYETHFAKSTLSSLDNEGCPGLAFVATDSIRQQRVVFTRTHILRFPVATEGADLSRPTNILAGGTRLSTAVAASSCFPPVFNRMRLTYRELRLNFNEFKDTLSVNDGGVAGNQGLSALQALRLLTRGMSLPIPHQRQIVISNAGRTVIHKPSGGAEADIGMMQEVITEAELKICRDLETDPGITVKRLWIGKRVDPRRYLRFEVQTLLARFRTDLDAPTVDEVNGLLRHGVAVAFEVLELSNDSTERTERIITSILAQIGCKHPDKAPTEESLLHCDKRSCLVVLIHAFMVALLLTCAACAAVFYAAGHLVVKNNQPSIRDTGESLKHWE